MAKARPSVLVESLSGHAGNVVFVNSKHGTLTRPRTKPHDPKTPAQTSQREAFTQAAQTYRNLDPQTHASWQTYAEHQTRIQSTTGAEYQPNAITLFTGLAAKLLQAGLPLPADSAPPTAPFIAPNLDLQAVAAPNLLILTNTGEPTDPDTAVEVLTQPLAHPLRKPIPSKLRTRAFVAFPNGSPTQELPLPPGAYAVAYRCVNLTTGQSTPISLLTNLAIP